jgi:hypothetical protein
MIKTTMTSISLSVKRSEQAARDLNPQLPVLETGTLPVELATHVDLSYDSRGLHLSLSTQGSGGPISRAGRGDSTSAWRTSGPRGSR